MRLEGFDIDIVTQGFPGKSICHGGLGWCTISLIRHDGRLILLDTGQMSMRGIVVARLKEHGLKPEDITDLILSHAHHDHSINWPMFTNARIYMGREEMEWALNEPKGRTPVPEFSIIALKASPQLRLVDYGEVPIPGFTAHSTPGHTPGHITYVLAGPEKDVVFTADAAKNRAELLSGDTDMTYDMAISKRSIDRIWELWRARPGNICVPGHDLPMVLGQDGEPVYLGRREASISAWFGRGMTDTHTISLTL